MPHGSRAGAAQTKILSVFFINVKMLLIRPEAEALLPDSGACSAQTYSATETQLMRRNGDIEHVRRSRQAGAQSLSLSPEERAIAADEDTDAASDSSEGAAAAHNDTKADEQSKSAGASQKRGRDAKGGKRSRNAEVAADALGDKTRAAGKQKKKRKKSEEATATGKGSSSIPGSGSAKKGARTKKNDKPLQ